jgi:NAD(P)-dependent dehydrogenase (short-subunit alcohol dehydrogenase family)
MTAGAGARLGGRKILITGAARGIGSAVAERCVAEGALVAVLDLDADEIQAVAAELGAKLGIGADVTVAAAVERAVADAVAALGGLDGLVNNAGIPMTGTVAELDEDDWDRVFAVNAKAVYLVSRAAWPHLLASNGGVIVNTGSIAGMWATENQPAYAAAKGATIMLTKCMALDGARDAIRVNSVSPGFIETPMLSRFIAGQPDPQAAREALANRAPLGGLGTPLDIADAFVYLLSTEARWVTGTNLVVDGGLTTSGIWG